MVDEMPGFANLWGFTNVDVNESLRRDTRTLEQGAVRLEQKYGIERFQSTQGSVNVLKGSHFISWSMERISRPLELFLCKFYCYSKACF